MALPLTQEEIDQKIEDGTLTYLEAKWLKDRDRLPAGYEMPSPPEQGDERPAPATKVTPLEEQSVPSIGNAGGIVDQGEDDEDYTDGWNNDQRRAELSTRGLSVQGTKDELIARLRRSDAGELIDGDESEV